MSLSPEVFEDSIGGLGVKGGSVLVMPTGKIIGVAPCDGWPLVIDPDGYVRTNMNTFEDGEVVWPPVYSIENGRYVDGPMDESRELAASILDLLERHCDINQDEE